MSTSDLLGRITIDPDICHGKPCIHGLRYRVDFLLELLADYPDLESEDLRAVYLYASRLRGVKSIATDAA